MTTFKVQIKGQKETAEIIEAEDSRKAKKMHSMKDGRKYNEFEAIVVLERVSKERADEIYEMRTRKAGWCE